MNSTMMPRKGRIYSLKLSLPQVIIMNISKFGIMYRKIFLFFSIQGTNACLSAVHFVHVCSKIFAKCGIVVLRLKKFCK